MSRRVLELINESFYTECLIILAAASGGGIKTFTSRLTSDRLSLVNINSVKVKFIEASACLSFLKKHYRRNLQFNWRNIMRIITVACSGFKTPPLSYQLQSLRCFGMQLTFLFFRDPNNYGNSNLPTK